MAVALISLAALSPPRLCRSSSPTKAQYRRASNTSRPHKSLIQNTQLLVPIMSFPEPELQVIDVRPAEAFDKLHVEGSFSFPWSLIKEDSFTLPARHHPVVAVVTSEKDDLIEAPADEIVAYLQKVGFSQIEVRPFGSFTNLTAAPTTRYSWTPNPFLEEALVLMESLNPSTLDIAVDVGTGCGRDAVYLCLKGWRVYGVENRRKLVGNCNRLAEKNHVGHRLLCICGDVNKGFPIKKHSVDFVNVCRFIHRGSFKPMLDLLRVGGFCLYSHFLDGCQDTAVGRPKNSAGFFLHGELESLLELHKFEVLLHRIGKLPDDRPMIHILARKTCL